MAYGLRIDSWDGHTEIRFDGTDYDAIFVEDAKTLDTPPAQTVETTRPGRSPKRAYSQPQSVRFGIEIVINVLTQANLDRLKLWFDSTTDEEKWLVATTDEGSGDQRRILCTSEGFEVKDIPSTGTTIFKANLYSESGIWESAGDDVPTPVDESITSSGETFDVTVAGSARSPLTISLVPTDALADTDGPTLFQRVFIANRAEGALFDWAAEGYSIDITGGGIDTDALEGDGKVRSDLNDLLVWLNGEYIPRWLSSNTPDAATRVFVNLHMQPGKFATLAEAIGDGDTLLTISDPEGFDGWPGDGFFFIENEPVQYHIDDLFTATLIRTVGVSHSAGASITWIEHPYLYLVYGYANAGTPDQGTDVEPRIDLSQSSNTLHVWTSDEGFLNVEERRSRSWRQTLSDKGVTGHIRTYDDSGAVFEDLAPEAGKPPYAELEMAFPVPLIGPLELDYEVGSSLHLRGRVFDLQGFESELISELSTEALTDQEFTMADPISKIRLLGRIAAVVGELDDTTLSSPLTLEPGTIGQYFPTETTRIGGSTFVSAVGTGGGGGGGGASAAGSVAIISGVSATVDAEELLFANLHTSIHFFLSEETEIDGFLALFADGDPATVATVYSGNGNGLDRAFFSVSFPMGDGLRFAELSSPVTVPAGEYWLVFELETATLQTRVRSKGGIFSGQMIVPNEPLEPSTVIPEGDRIYIGSDMIAQIPWATLVNEGQSPIFAVLSKTNDPQADAPTQTGAQIVLDNIEAPLDSSRAPQIRLMGEEDLGLIEGRLRNNTTGDYVDVAFLSKLDQGLELNTDTGEVTDIEFGLPVGFATEYGNPDTKLYAKNGVNEFEWIQPGVVGLDITVDYLDFYL